jgi:hypothetical protein
MWWRGWTHDKTNKKVIFGTPGRILNKIWSSWLNIHRCCRLPPSRRKRQAPLDVMKRLNNMSEEESSVRVQTCFYWMWWSGWTLDKANNQVTFETLTTLHTYIARRILNKIWSSWLNIRRCCRPPPQPPPSRRKRQALLDVMKRLKNASEEESSVRVQTRYQAQCIT